ncbi:hypothetical protein BDQ17DRAFT_1240635 [Cyathus striatus]|nr:hypothetical protein BDQ17DRAFT_1240635 [Cyathus striatus]
MWVLTGPFDGELGADLNLQKSKLLKTGTSYPLGRKDRPLCIANKKVSHDHCEFIVGKYSADDVSNPTSRPSLEIVNKKDKGIRLMREGAEAIVNPMAAQELRDGDVIHVVTGVPVKITWHTICCFSPKSSYSIETCALLGINLVHIPDRCITHHLTPTYNASPLIACSLVTAAHFVKPEWLHEVIKLGAEPHNGTSLEESFVLPPINKFRPTFSPSLSTTHKVFSVWEPNEERLHMFADFRFICVGEKPRELDSDMRELIHRAGGTLDVFEVHSGASKFHRTLTRGHAKVGKKLVLVANAKAMKAAIGQDEWQELVIKAKSFDHHFVNPDTIIQAVLDIDPTAFDKVFDVDKDTDRRKLPRSTSPNFVSNTLADEPSQLPSSQPPKKILARRAASRQPSVEAVISSPIEVENSGGEAPKPRRTLTRRVNAGKPMVTGLDDPSIILDAIPEIPVARLTPPPRSLMDLTAPTPARSSRLKRRIVGVTSDNAPPPSLGTQDFPSTINETSEGPPLKKFKALFDESDPDRVIAESSLEESESLDRSFTQTQTQFGFQFRAPRTYVTNTNMSLLREEDEESQSLASVGVLSRGTKRTLDCAEDEDMEVDEAESAGLDTDQPASKKRAVEAVNAVERAAMSEPLLPIPLTSSKPACSAVPSTGAAPGKPDKDAAFLKAIASTKRGKKSEDNFDREFNNLKISKPDLDREERENEWNILADFGDDSGIRGNFMTIVEMPLFRENRNRRNDQSNAPQWAGKPNFKKFKSKDIERSHRSRIELIPTEGDNVDEPETYWKDGTSQAQNDFSTEYLGMRSQSRMLPRKLSTIILEDDSNDDEISPRRIFRSKPPSKASSSTVKQRTTRAARKVGSVKDGTPLFLDSDDDKEDGTIIMEDDDSQTLQSGDTKNSRAKPNPVAKSSTRAIVIDDDSDDEGVFKGFATKATRSRRR